jgi:hypothetical protein
MFGKNSQSAVEKAAAEKARQAIRDLARSNGNKPSSEFTKRELLALEIFKRLEYDDYEDSAEYSVAKADALLIALES